MRTPIRAAALVCVLAAGAMAQSKPFDLNARGPEMTLLNLANQEEDAARKATLLDDFIAKNPKHAGVVYAGPILQDLLLKQAKYDRVIEVAPLVLAVDPATPVAAYNALQAAEQKKDFAAILDWVAKTVAAAKTLSAVAKPDSDALLEFWTAQQDYAKQVVTRCEYSLFSSSLQTQDAATKAKLGDALMALNPNSQYLAQVAPHYIFGLLQTNRGADAAAVAEKILAIDKANDDMMAVAADYYLSAKDYEKAANYAAQLIATVPAKTAPAGVDAAAYDKAKNAKLARGYFISGDAAYELKKYVEADKQLRAAIPLAAGNNDLLGPIYFYLGFANHELGKAAKPLAAKPILADAKKFTAACAAIAGPYQATCQKNLQAMTAGK